jgi:hypothetical protein
MSSARETYSKLARPKKGEAAKITKGLIIFREKF